MEVFLENLNETIEINEKQKMFCEYYLEMRIAYQAYIRAFSTDTKVVPERSARALSSLLLANVNVQKYLKELEAQRRKQSGIDAQFIIERAMHVYNECARPKHKWMYDPDKKEMVKSEDTYIDAKGANGALDIIAKVSGLNSIQFKGEVMTKSNAEKLAEQLFGPDPIKVDDKL